VLGLLFADTAAGFIMHFAPDGAETFNISTSADGRIIGFAAAATALTTFVFGLLPALRKT
jgi:hypothetical protein